MPFEAVLERVCANMKRLGVGAETVQRAVSELEAEAESLWKDLCLVFAPNSKLPDAR